MIPVGSLPVVGQPDLPEPTLGRPAGADPTGKKASAFDDLLNGNPAKPDEDKDAAALNDAAQSAANAKDPAKTALPAPMAGWPWMVQTTALPPEPTAKLTDSPAVQGNSDNNAESASSSTSPSPGLLGGGIATLKRALLTAPAPTDGASPGNNPSNADGISLPRPMLGSPKGKPSPDAGLTNPDDASLPRPMLGFPKGKPAPDVGLTTDAASTPTPAPAPAPVADSASIVDPISPSVTDDPALMAAPLAQGAVRWIPTDTPSGDPTSKIVANPLTGPALTPDPLPVQLLPDALPVSPAAADEGENLALPRPMLSGPGWKPSAPPADDISATQPSPMLGGPGWKPSVPPANGGNSVTSSAPAATTRPVSLPVSTETAASANPAANTSVAAPATAAVDAAYVGANAVFATGTENFAPKAPVQQVASIASSDLRTWQVTDSKGNRKTDVSFGTSVAKTTDSMPATQITEPSASPSGDGSSALAASGGDVTGGSETPAKSHGATASAAFHLPNETLAPARETLSSDTSLPADSGASTRASDAATLLQRTMDAGEQMRASGRGHVEVQVPISDKENVTIQLRWENGSLHTTFRTDSPELRQALERDWSQFTARCSQERGLPLAANLNFESSRGNASSSAGGQNDSNRQQQQPQPQTGDDAAPLTFTTDYLRVAANPRASLAAAAAAAPVPNRKDPWKAWA